MKTSFIHGLTAAVLVVAMRPAVHAQSAAKTQSPSATVNVIVTDTKNVPLTGAEVLFIPANTRKPFSGVTDKGGKFSMALPAGMKYTIKMKTLNDTSDYSAMEIPALGPGQSFTAPFTVSIQYEPPRTFTLNNVHFDTGKPTLRPDSFKELNEMAEFMKIKSDDRYEIAGHTDNVGKEEDNLKLSQQRAETVKSYLVKKGIDAARITAKGYGALKPVADNTTAEGRQQNRRTEVLVL